MDVPNFVRTQVEYHGVGRLELWRRRRQVKLVTVIPYQTGKTYGHILTLTPIHPKSLEKMRRANSHRIY